MSTLSILEQRRQLVLLSAGLQRATIRRRLDAVEQRPRVALFGSLAAIAAQPGVRRVALGVALMAYRAWRRRRG
ncbi:hypothetical protein BWI17_04035 [Betaproteobacteria bacterium GR16-43]|nr:hypothetical protein BWI17_04035 [Betaproteobacteria bacterium GR16-43]